MRNNPIAKASCLAWPNSPTSQDLSLGVGAPRPPPRHSGGLTPATVGPSRGVSRASVPCRGWAPGGGANRRVHSEGAGREARHTSPAGLIPTPCPQRQRLDHFARLREVQRTHRHACMYATMRRCADAHIHCVHTDTHPK